jgi:hypothetical protein
MLTPIQPLHLSGLLHQPRNLLFRWGRADPAPQRLGSVVYLWRKASTNGACPNPGVCEVKARHILICGGSILGGGPSSFRPLPTSEKVSTRPSQSGSRSLPLSYLARRFRFGRDSVLISVVSVLPSVGTRQLDFRTSIWPFRILASKHG